MNLTLLIRTALAESGLDLRDTDALLIGQKIISKAENRFVDLDSVRVSPRARELAARRGKDPRLVEVILGESTQVVRCAPRVLIVRHRLGLVVANAAVDQSNVPGSASRALLLPLDPDASRGRAATGIYPRCDRVRARHRHHRQLWPALAPGRLRHRHRQRREWQSHGWSAARVCSELAALYGVSARLLPMSNAPAPTCILTSAGELPFPGIFCQATLRARGERLRIRSVGSARRQL